MNLNVKISKSVSEAYFKLREMSALGIQSFLNELVKSLHSEHIYVQNEAKEVVYYRIQKAFSEAFPDSEEAEYGLNTPYFSDTFYLRACFSQNPALQIRILVPIIITRNLEEGQDGYQIDILGPVFPSEYSKLKNQFDIRTRGISLRRIEDIVSYGHDLLWLLQDGHSYRIKKDFDTDGETYRLVVLQDGKDLEEWGTFRRFPLAGINPFSIAENHALLRCA